MMKKAAARLLLLCFLLSGCASAQPPVKQYTATFLNLFDTVTTIVGYAASEEAFQQQAQKIHDELLVYHQLFDIYNDYKGINNIKTINDHAGISPVKVDSAVISLLTDCADYYERTDGNVNVDMGSILKLWHEARTDGIRDPMNAYLPDADALNAAAHHISFENIYIDAAASTVYITDPQASLDLGAIAKGWSAQRVAEQAPAGLLISVGGNVCATGPKQGGNPWIIGIQNPDGGDNLHTIYVSDGAVVTSGDYQRAYTVNGKKYHHIIAPNTRMPAEYWRSVTVVCCDSGMADALSTALFLLPLEQGKELAEKWDAEVFWLDKNGQEFMTPGFQSLIRT